MSKLASGAHDGCAERCLRFGLKQWRPVWIRESAANMSAWKQLLGYVPACNGIRYMTARKQAFPSSTFADGEVVHQLFERQAESSPQALAISSQGEQISYRALNNRSNAIAHALFRFGLEAKQPVAVMLEDGPRQIESLFGVFKAGGVIVCLDVEHPTARLRTILQDTQPSLIITDSACAHLCGALTRAPGLPLSKVLIVDQDSLRLAQVSADGGLLPETDVDTSRSDNPDRAIQSDDPVYIVYTSGSTGKPKGIVQSHRSFCQFINWQSSQFGIRAPQRVAQWASISYDAGYRQIFGTLCFGATLCMAPKSIRYNPAALIDWLQSEKVTILNVVPSFCAELIGAAGSQQQPGRRQLLPDLEQLLLTGEVLPAEMARRWFGLFANPPRLWNLYGPSECILACCYAVEKVSDDQHSMPIGRAIGEREILILDDDSKPCADGVAGEIYIRSNYLTLGYFGRPEETASSFIQNPCNDDYPDPVYRTGDLGMVNADGVIEFLGRRDNQIKLRGMRVELGEIEAALREFEEIENCAVVVRKLAGKRNTLIAKDRNARLQTDPLGQQVLVAFFTAANDLSGSVLREILAGKLPAHMVPQQYVRLDELPVNANRKLDRVALAEFDFRHLKHQQPYAAPRNTREAKVCEIWADVLGVEQVGVNDSFFELGGDSLLAMQVLNRLRRAIAVKLTFRHLLEKQTVAGLATLIEQQRETPVTSAAATKVIDQKSVCPLTLSQQGIWFLWRLEPQSPYYTGQGTLQLKGEFDLLRFQKTWHALLARHEILRVRFGNENGLPVQHFDRTPDTALDCTDLTHLPANEQWHAIEAAANAKTNRALDLEQDPLFQAELFEISETEHQLLLTFHEIVLDLWGLSILVRDFAALYQKSGDGDVALLPPADISFREYAVWEHDNINRSELEQQKAYWQAQLHGELPVLELPTDRPRPETQSYRGASESIVLSTEESKKLRDLASQNNATLFMTLLAALNILLRAYSRQDDIIVGAPIANRTQEGNEDLAGFFLNMLPLRCRFESEVSFRDMLSVVRETVTGAICNADYPFMWMLEEANVQRNPAVTPVFQVMFNMLNLPHESAELADLEVTYNEIDTPYIKYDLCLYSQEHDDRIYLELAYLTDLFDAATIERMLANFRVLLNSIVESPGSPLHRLNMQSVAEAQKLEREFNDTDREFGNDLCIHQLFERQVEETPDEIAFICGAEQITFAGLNVRSNRLAHYLRASGVGRETRVAICTERSLEMMVSLLAVMKAGGTYVALDPDYPLLRIKDILADTVPPVLLLQERLDRFDDFGGTKIYVDTEWSRISEQDSSNPVCVNEVTDILNIVYTSSTTGSPKGVLITAEAVLNRLFWMWDAYPFEPDSVAVLQKSYALVAATWECFGALLQGYRTIILTRQAVQDPSEFWKQLVTTKVTHLLASPAVLEGVLTHAENNPGQWDSIRLATTSAEPIAPAMVRRWHASFPDTPLLNLYGSTECSSNVTQYDTRQLPESATRVPIGTPLANTRVYITDKHLNLCPIGVVGEMHVAGACLARGYLNNADLMEKHFLPDPFSSDPGSLIYKTGDMGKYKPDGTIELLGRADRQVNIRGFRVELNDIENTLLQHVAVQKCAAILRESSSGNERLVAYLVASEDTSTTELRAFLRDRLPDYMIPADYVFLASLPVTPAGKVDSRALPDPELSRRDMDVAYVAPESPIEKTLASIWQELLETDSVGVHDDFFDLGGHSLLASRMLFRVRKLTGVEVPLRTLFETPSIAALADAIHLLQYADSDVANDAGSGEREEISL